MMTKTNLDRARELSLKDEIEAVSAAAISASYAQQALIKSYISPAVKEIISTVDTRSAEDAESFADEIRDSVAGLMDTEDGISHLDKVNEVVKSVAQCMQDAKEQSVDDALLEEVLKFFQEQKLSIKRLFNKLRYGQETADRIEKELEQQNRRVLEKRVEDFLAGHDRRIQQLGLLKVEIPNVKLSAEKNSEMSKELIQKLRDHISAGQLIIEAIEKDDKTDWSDDEIKEREEFCSILGQKLFIMNQEYMIASSSQVQLNRANKMLANMQDTVDSLIDKEMPYIEQNVVRAGRALHLLQMYDLLEKTEESAQQNRKELVEMINAAQQSKEGSLESREKLINELEERHEQLTKQTLLEQQQRQNLAEQTRALQEQVVNDSVDEAAALAKQYKGSRASRKMLISGLKTRHQRLTKQTLLEQEQGHDIGYRGPT